MAFTKTTENDRPHPAAPGGPPAPRVPDTGGGYARPSCADPCGREGKAGVQDLLMDYCKMKKPL